MDLGSFVEATPGLLNQSVTSQSQVGSLRNKSIPAKKRQKNLMSFGPAQAQVQTAQKATQRRRSTFRKKERATAQSQIIDFTPPMIEDGSGVRNEENTEPQDEFAYDDYEQRRDRVQRDLNPDDFQLKLRSAKASPRSHREAINKSQHVPRSSRERATEEQ